MSEAKASLSVLFMAIVAGVLVGAISGSALGGLAMGLLVFAGLSFIISVVWMLIHAINRVATILARHQGVDPKVKADIARMARTIAKGDQR